MANKKSNLTSNNEITENILNKNSVISILEHTANQVSAKIAHTVNVHAKGE